MKSRSVQLALLFLALFHRPCLAAVELRDGAYHVRPGDQIQDALQLAATNRAVKTVKVHPGTYRPHTKRQALIWFNKAHTGIRLEAIGDVTLTAANPDLAAPGDPGYPAVVNHIVYFGDGVTSNTLLTGFRMTGANGFLTKDGTQAMESSRIPKNHFFFSDGGAIKIFGRSSPTLRNLEVVDNYSNPCGGGISIQHMGLRQSPLLIENCVFRNNRAQATGPAIDLLAGSSARIINCLFVGNISNLGEDPVARESGEKPFVNNGAVTVFWNSHALMENCTFTGNRNGIDDMGTDSRYLNCIIVDNNLEAGLPGYPRYALAVNAGATVGGCLMNGMIHDARKSVSPTNNILNAPNPRFDEHWVPQAPEYKNAGYRPRPRARGPVDGAQSR